MKNNGLLLFAVFFYVTGIATAATYYVNGGWDGGCGNDTWSGLSAVCSAPDGPKLTISAGIAAAVNGDTVIVADGLYFGVNNMDLDFSGKAITLRSENGSNSTIINCGWDGRGFSFQNGEDANSVLDGFTIKNGENQSGDGGGIFILNSSPIIRNCIIDSGRALYSYGGNIYIDGGKPLIRDCRIDNGSAPTGGGGIYIKNQTAEANGEKLRIINCKFSNNQGYNGGAIYIDSGAGEVVIANCEFSYSEKGSYNPGSVSGGAIFSGYGSPQVSITNSIFNDNHATYWGGAIASFGSMRVVNCLFYANSTTDDDWSSFPDFSGGGAIAVRGGVFEMSNSTVVSNTCSKGMGGGMVVELGGVANISNSIFWGNTVRIDRFGTEIFVSGTSSTVSLVYCGLPPDNCVPYCNAVFIDSTGEWGGTINLGAGIVRADPLFKGFYSNDYHLSDVSPLIDVGDNNLIMNDIADLDGDSDINEPIPFDLDGNTRIFNQTVDMGAYEIGVHCPVPLAGDINGDCQFDLLDFAQMVPDWLKCNLIPQSECAN